MTSAAGGGACSLYPSGSSSLLALDIKYSSRIAQLLLSSVSKQASLLSLFYAVFYLTSVVCVFSVSSALRSNYEI